MKYLLVNILLLIAANSICQVDSTRKIRTASKISMLDGLDGFFGLPFHSTKNEVEKEMSLKKAVKIFNDGENLMFNRVSFSGYLTESVVFEFSRGEMISGNVVILDEPISLYRTYKQVVKQIEDKYKDKKKLQKMNEIENYAYPFEKGDGHMLTALEAGKAEIKTNWIFEDLSFVVVRIDKDLKITLLYNEPVTKEKEKNDF